MTARTLFRSLLVAVATLLALAPAALAAPGDLDTSFGSGKGYTTVSSGTELNGVAVQPDGQVVAVGDSGLTTVPQPGIPTPNAHLLVQRFSPSGSPEGAFSTGSGVGNAVVIQPDGKIVVAGYDSSGWLIERFNSDGSPDGSFGSGGFVHAFPGARSEANAIALGPGATIVVAGQVPGADSFLRGAVLRLSSGGSTVGSFTVNLGEDTVVSGVAAQADGKIVVAGSQGPGAYQIVNAFVARLTSSGSKDSGFSVSGSLWHATGPGYEVFPQGGGGAIYFNAVTLDPAGAIVIGGASPQNNADKAIFARLGCSGAPDGSFGGSGLVAVASSSGFTAESPGPGLSAVAAAAGGHVIGAGEFTANLDSAALYGQNSNGTEAFRSVVPASGGQPTMASSLAVDGTGRFVTAGEITMLGSLPNGFVARFQGYGSPASGSNTCGGAVVPPPSKGRATLVHKTLPVHNRKATITLQCSSSSTCSGRLTITRREHVIVGGHHKLVTLRCVARKFSISAGKTVGITARVRAGCMALLRTASNHRITATLRVTMASGQAGLLKRVTLALA